MNAASAAVEPAYGDRVQHDLAVRVASIGLRAPNVSTATLAAEVDAIRAVALAHGLFPAVAVTHAIATALARGERVLWWSAGCISCAMPCRAIGMTAARGRPMRRPARFASTADAALAWTP